MNILGMIKNRKRYNVDYSNEDKDARKITKIIVGLILVVVAVALFLPYLVGIHVELSATSIDIKAPLTSQKIDYSDIDTIELVTEMPKSTRKIGLSSLGLETGTYSCDEYGSYYRATYKECLHFIVILRISDSSYSVFNQKNEEMTTKLYQDILAVLSN